MTHQPRSPGRASQASPSGASVQPKSRPCRTPDSLPLHRSGNLPRASSAADAPWGPAGVAAPPSLG